MLLVERQTGSSNQVRESPWCTTGWSRLEERKDRRHAHLLHSLHSPIVSEDRVGIIPNLPQQCNKHVPDSRAREGYRVTYSYSSSDSLIPRHLLLGEGKAPPRRMGWVTTWPLCWSMIWAGALKRTRGSAAHDERVRANTDRFVH